VPYHAECVARYRGTPTRGREPPGAAVVKTYRAQVASREAYVLDAYPDSGRLFLADVGTAGLPTPRWNGDTATSPWRG
jgi:hypothetical protein